MLKKVSQGGGPAWHHHGTMRPKMVNYHTRGSDRWIFASNHCLLLFHVSEIFEEPPKKFRPFLPFLKAFAARDPEGARRPKSGTTLRVEDLGRSATEGGAARHFLTRSPRDWLFRNSNPVSQTVFYRKLWPLKVFGASWVVN